MNPFYLSLVAALAVALVLSLRVVFATAMVVTLGVSGLVVLAAWSYVLYGSLFAIASFAPDALRWPAFGLAVAAALVIAVAPAKLAERQAADFEQSLTDPITPLSPRAGPVRVLEVRGADKPLAEHAHVPIGSAVCPEFCRALLETGEVEAVRVQVTGASAGRMAVVDSRLFVHESGCRGPHCLRPAVDNGTPATLRLALDYVDPDTLPRGALAPFVVHSASTLRLWLGDALIASQQRFAGARATTPYLIGADIPGGSLHSRVEVGAWRLTTRSGRIDVIAALRSAGLEVGPETTPVARTVPMSRAYFETLFDLGLEENRAEAQALAALRDGLLAQAEPLTAAELRFLERLYLRAPKPAAEALRLTAKHPDAAAMLLEAALSRLENPDVPSDWSVQQAVAVLSYPDYTLAQTAPFAERYLEVFLTPRFGETELGRALPRFVEEPARAVLPRLQEITHNTPAWNYAFDLLRTPPPDLLEPALAYLWAYAVDRMPLFETRALRGKTLEALEILHSHGRTQDVRALLTEAKVYRLDAQLERFPF